MTEIQIELIEILLVEQGHEAPVVRSLYDAAVESYGLLMQRFPGDHTYPVSLAHIHKADGDMDAAVELYRKSYEDRREYEYSFEFYGKGNALRHARNRHSPEHLRVRQPIEPIEPIEPITDTAP